MARILIVDDDPDVVQAATMVLQKEGHEVDSASGPKEGMDKIRAKKPDLLVLDIMMEEPDDGIAMAQKLRKSGFRQPILILSSIASVTGMKYGKDKDVTPVDDFVEKPVKPATLIGKVNALLKGK
jgi:DNA-binding response OmpR family regulator